MRTVANILAALLTVAGFVFLVSDVLMSIALFLAALVFVGYVIEQGIRTNHDETDQLLRELIRRQGVPMQGNAPPPAPMNPQERFKPPMS